MQEMNKQLYACYASSDYYARETGISMIGFFENNLDYEPEEIFILDYGILPSNKLKLDSIANKYGRFITYLPAKQILEDIQEQLNLKDFRGSLATYSRAFIDKIMPQYVDRLLYIDSDTVVVGPVSELKLFDMGDSCMAGIVSGVFSNQLKNGSFKLYSGNKVYYGCGIVLFDLTNWRNRDCYSKITHTFSIKKNYPCADQTLINNSLPEDYFKKLPLKYNYTTHYLSESVEKEKLRKGAWYSDTEIQEAITNTVVVHYAGYSKMRPWYEGCISRRKDEYFKYKIMSPWRTDKLFPIEDKTKSNSLSSNFNKFVQRIEADSKNTVLLNVISLLRVLIGRPLRLIGLIPKLPNEGIE